MDERKKVRIFLEGKRKKFLLQKALTDLTKLRLPGGGIEPGEKPIDAVKRELNEEFHISPEQLKIKYIGKSNNKNPYTKNEWYYHVSNHGLKPGKYQDNDNKDTVNELVMSKLIGKNIWSPDKNILDKLEKKASLLKEAATSYFEALRENKQAISPEEMKRFTAAGIPKHINIWKTKVSNGNDVYIIHTHKRLKMAKTPEGIIYQYYKHFRK